jgi:hypothetical protein
MILAVSCSIGLTSLERLTFNDCRAARLPCLVFFPHLKEFVYNSLYELDHIGIGYLFDPGRFYVTTLARVKELSKRENICIDDQKLSLLTRLELTCGPSMFIDHALDYFNSVSLPSLKHLILRGPSSTSAAPSWHAFIPGKNLSHHSGGPF